MRIAITATLAALLAGAAVAAQDPAAEPATAPDATVSADEEEIDLGDFDPLKIVCRRVRPPTGTRIVSGQTRQQMCMTRADWEQQELDAQEAIKVRDEGTCAPGQCGG